MLSFQKTLFLFGVAVHVAVSYIKTKKKSINERKLKKMPQMALANY